MSLLALLHQVEQQAREQLRQAAVLPAEVRLRFDPARETSPMDDPHASATPCGGVRKTACRTVVSLEHGGCLKDLREELASRRPAINIPLSTLSDQQRKFLFYLGCLHRQAAPLLRQYLAAHGPVTWLLDGTTEPETAVFLGIEEAAHGLLLGNWKIPSEVVQLPCPVDLAGCLP